MAKTSKDYPHYDEPFPNRIRDLLAQTNTPAQTLGDYLGISQQAVNLYCFGETKPTVERLVKIAKYFGVTTDYLLGLSEVKSYEIETQAASKRYGLSEQALQKLEYLTTLSRLHEKHQQLTDSIFKYEQILTEHRNDKTDEYAVGVFEEQYELNIERNTLENKMLELADPGEGYIKPPKWAAPIICQQAWQKLHSIGALLTLEQGEKTLNEIGEYLYMGDLVDREIIVLKGTPQIIRGDDIAKIKLFNVQEGLVKVRQALTDQ